MALDIKTLVKALKSPTGKTIGGVLGGGALGSALAEFENRYIYEKPATKEVSSFMGPSTGALAGALLAHSKIRKPYGAIGLGALVGLTGLKQLGLMSLEQLQKASDSIDAYTSIQNELADKNVTITKNQLDTAIANKDVANRALDMSKKWHDTAKVALPAAGGLAALLTSLYAYNSLKPKKESKQPITLKVDNKSPDRRNAMYIEVPASKVSDKFYSQFSRELLFKDEQEKYMSIKGKKESGMNLTSAEKKILDKFEKHASALNSEFNDYKNPSYDFSNDLTIDPIQRATKTTPMHANPRMAFRLSGEQGAINHLRQNASNLNPDEKLQILNNIKNEETPFWMKLMNMILPALQTTGILPTQNK